MIQDESQDGIKTKELRKSRPEKMKRLNKDNIKRKRKEFEIMMTFGIMTVAVVAFAVIACAGMNLSINSCK